MKGQVGPFGVHAVLQDELLILLLTIHLSLSCLCPPASCEQGDAPSPDAAACANAAHRLENLIKRLDGLLPYMSLGISTVGLVAADAAAGGGSAFISLSRLMEASQLLQQSATAASAAHNNGKGGSRARSAKRGGRRGSGPHGSRGDTAAGGGTEAHSVPVLELPQAAFYVHKRLTAAGMSLEYPLCRVVVERRGNRHRFALRIEQNLDDEQYHAEDETPGHMEIKASGVGPLWSRGMTKSQRGRRTAVAVRQQPSYASLPNHYVASTAGI